MKRTYQDFLRDIITAIDHATTFVEDIDLSDFQANTEKQYAVVRTLEISQYPNRDTYTVSSSALEREIGMRNIVIHQYFGVDEEVVWRTIHEDLPPLRDAVQKIINE